uniref:Guanine nucleotide regulatory protein n=1 Tax=Paramecium tetraurelia TaxID=5888 RepID=Q27158_PARTE|nr:guanine nucleotide regulatory protein [Paramecium tetraurelia]
MNNNQSNSAISIKLVIVGDGSVGKTCILIRYTEDKFPTDYVPTIFENYCAQVLYENKMVNLNLWDTAGQEEYKQLRSISYPQSDVFLITFSVDEPSSFQNAIKKWYPELQADQPNAPKIFIGNKIDMRPTENVNENKFVTFNIAQKAVSDLGCKYIECSALNGTNIKQIFLEAIKQAMKKKFPQQTSQTSGPAKTQTGTQRKSNSNDNADASGKCSIQ